jgi:hypothetical protein
MLKRITIFITLCIFTIIQCEGQTIDAETKYAKEKVMSVLPIRADEQYKKALKLYEEAKIDTSLKLLKAIPKTFSFKLSSSDLKANVYRLTAMSYLLVDSIADARKNIKKMLTYRPFYKDENITEDDLQRFVDALDTLMPSPRLYLGLRMGANYSNMQIGNQYHVIEGQNTISSKPQLAVNIGLCAGFAFSKHFSVAFEPEFFQCKSQIESSIWSSTSQSIVGLQKYKSTQTFNYFNLPLTFRANVFFNKRKTMPYLEFGGYYSLLISGSETINNEVIPTDKFLQNTNYGLLFGLGFMQFYKNFVVGLNARF